MTTDIGDTVSLSLTITHPLTGALVDPDTVTIAVARPDGSAAAPDVILNPSTGVYQSAVTVDAAGTWAATWTTTDPNQVERHQFIVAQDPPNRLTPLATIDDIEQLLGRQLTDAEALLAPGQLHSASVRLRAFCRQRFNLVTDDSVVLRPVGTIVRLPHTPVVDVTSVTAVGSNSIPDFVVPGWTFDGLELIDLRGALNPDVWVSLPASTRDLDYNAVTYRVVYSHGWAVIPDLVVDIVAGAALRTLTSPSETGGLTQVTVGQYSEQHQQATGTAGRRPYLTADDKRLLVDAGLRRGDQGTIQLTA